MSRKVFISFLGTNSYVETYYLFPNNKKSGYVKYIQEALIMSDCINWSPEDKILIFCTEKASEQNWLSVEGLQSRLQLNYPIFDIVEKVDIPEGFSEKEIWQIFDVVYSKLSIGDEVYFDVTHAFRSIPLFSTVLFNYSHFMKDVNVVSIKYGAFEKLGPAYKVREMPAEERLAPVIDLTNIVLLQEFTDLASSMKTYGRVGKISNSLKQYTKENEVIGQMSQGIEDFEEYLLSNKMVKIQEGKWVCAIKNSVRKVHSSNIPLPIKNLVESLDNELVDFKPMKSNENIEAAINWATKYNMLSNAYTLGQEYIILLLEEKLKSLNPFGKSKEFRMYLSAICSISQDDVKNNKFKDNLEKYKDLTLKILSLDYIQKLRQYFPKLGEYRNCINHAKNADVTYQMLVDDFNELYQNCLSVLKSC